MRPTSSNNNPAPPNPPAEAPTPGLARLNALDAPDAARALLTVCGSRRWVDRMTGLRPFASADHLFAAAEREWRCPPLDRADWLEAFSHHPRIGERRLDQPRFEATREQSSREQSGMAAASDALREEFHRLNREYEARFGHVFLICASGQTAEYMLGQIRARIANDAETELRNAAREQGRIIRLRLERMLNT
jgi:2-oxo-4-hydroxy-4-carboxy-5-ureidoimidazoline decarboxylase